MRATRPSPPFRELVVSTLKQMEQTQVWLAGELRWSPSVLKSVLWHDQPLTVRRAVQIEQVLDVNAEFLLQAYIGWELEHERQRWEGHG